ncbi:FxSxx-COOH cyclophane-containing RiPP peptide [Micromonospora sp. NPDC023737]|uniref:FxSxx-COOH cyclophane-containing RiPP peptide n=1 Tax=unclassified Micromonospora TaxID=2617518 RepID=UPI0033DE5850
MDAREEVLRSDLIDLTDVDPAALDALPDTVLLAALRRLERRTAAPDAQYAGFESVLDGED